MWSTVGLLLHIFMCELYWCVKYCWLTPICVNYTDVWSTTGLLILCVNYTDVWSTVGLLILCVNYTYVWSTVGLLMLCVNYTVWNTIGRDSNLSCLKSVLEFIIFSNFTLFSVLFFVIATKKWKFTISPISLKKKRNTLSPPD